MRGDTVATGRLSVMPRVLHLTDTHVVAHDTGTDRPDSFAGAVAQVQGRTTGQLLAAVLKAVAAAGVEPDVVLHTGDVTDDGQADSYRTVRDQLAPLGVPVLIMPGNHDEPTALAATFGHEPAELRWTDVGAWRIVTLNTSVQDQDHGNLSPSALAELDTLLGVADRPVLLGLHHPPHSVCPEAACQLEQAPELLEVIRRHPVVRAVASGHTHVADDQEHDGIAFLSSPSTCLQLRHDHPLPENNQEPTAIGARVIDLHDDGTVSSHVIWAAGPKEPRAG